MRIGLIGAGRIGNIHAQNLLRLDAVEEILVYDIDHGRARALAEGLGRSWTDSVEDLLGRADAAVIASTTDTHAPLLHRAAEAGVPAFCEKPIALALAESRAAVEAVRRAGILVQMGFQRRFDPGHLRIRDLVRGGELGTVYLLRHVSHDHDVPTAGYVPTSGGIYKDNLIHDFDLIRFVTGDEVEEVYAAGAVLVAEHFGRHGDVDTAAVTLRLAGGAIGLLSAVRHDPVGYDVRLEVFGSRDTVAAGWTERTPVTRIGPGGTAEADARPADPYRTWTARFGEAYRAEMEAFVQAVGSGPGDIAATPRDAHEALRVAVACGISRDERRPVRVSEVDEGSSHRVAARAETGGSS